MSYNKYQNKIENLVVLLKRKGDFLKYVLHQASIIQIRNFCFTKE